YPRNDAFLHPVLMDSLEVGRSPPNASMRQYSIPCSARLFAKASSLNCGLWRDFGIVRTSTTNSTWKAFNISINASIGCVECPIVKILSAIDRPLVRCFWIRKHLVNGKLAIKLSTSACLGRDNGRSSDLHKHATKGQTPGN